VLHNTHCATQSAAPFPIAVPQLHVCSRAAPQSWVSKPQPPCCHSLPATLSFDVTNSAVDSAKSVPCGASVRVPFMRTLRPSTSVTTTCTHRVDGTGAVWMYVASSERVIGAMHIPPADNRC
jgi:hypothetical protein